MKDYIKNLAKELDCQKNTCPLNDYKILMVPPSEIRNFDRMLCRIISHMTAAENR